MTELIRAVTFRNLETGQAVTVSARIGTRATHAALPKAEADQIRLRANGYREFGEGDGRVISLAVASVEATVEGHSAPMVCAFGEQVDEAVLGTTSLSALMLRLDDENEELVPVRPRMGGGLRPV